MILIRIRHMDSLLNARFFFFFPFSVYNVALLSFLYLPHRAYLQYICIYCKHFRHPHASQLVILLPPLSVVVVQLYDSFSYCVRNLLFPLVSSLY